MLVDSQSKPRLVTTPAGGSTRLIGEYTIPLAAVENREIWAVLTIDEDNAWVMYFRVRIGKQLFEFSTLPKAARHFDGEQ